MPAEAIIPTLTGGRGPATVYKSPTVAARADRLSRARVAARANLQRATRNLVPQGLVTGPPLMGRSGASFDALCSRRPAATRLGRPRESRSPAGLLPTRGRRTARQDPTRVSPRGTPRRPGPPPPTTTTCEMTSPPPPPPTTASSGRPRGGAPATAPGYKTCPRADYSTAHRSLPRAGHACALLVGAPRCLHALK